MTKRDQIWNAALELLVAKGKFRASHVMVKCGFDECQRQTVLRTLCQLGEQGWLEHESEQSSIW